MSTRSGYNPTPHCNVFKAKHYSKKYKGEYNMNVLEAREEYREYIDTHVANVYRAWEENIQYFKPLTSEMGEAAIRVAYRNILDHDKSKYSVEEFEPYRKNFYPISEGEKKLNKGDFDMAWKHHYTNNLHHWQSWVDEATGFAKPMDDIYIIEMLCDWIAMGHYNGNPPKQYYQENKDTINIHPGTRKKLEEILNKLPE